MFAFLISKISKPHPRKGTETGKGERMANLVGNFKTTSPQGDGNLVQTAVARYVVADFKTTSPQGDGMCEPQPPLPRRGRGTMRSMVEGAP